LLIAQEQAKCCKIVHYEFSIPNVINMNMRFHFLVLAGVLIRAFNSSASADCGNYPYFDSDIDSITEISCGTSELGVSAVTAFKAEFSYKAQCSQVIEHGVCFSEKPTPVRGKSQKVAFYKGFPLDIPAETTFKVVTDNLIPETQYYARAYVKNLDGDIFYSKELNFATPVSDSALFPKKQEINGFKQEYYKNGNLMRSFTIRDGLVDGSYKFYSDSGQLVSDQLYRNGAMDGPLTTYYRNGQIKSVSNFSNNQLQGSAKEYYENGNLKKESNFTGEPFRFTGQATTYYESGKIESEITMSDGEFKQSINYDQQGRVTLEQTPGQSISYSYEPDGWKHTSLNGEKCQCSRCND
jgi:hypothetical protein